MNSAKRLLIIIITSIILLKLVSADDLTFFSAARVGDVETVLSMLKNGFDVHSVDQKGNSALIIASGRGRVEVLKVLLTYGSDVESITRLGLFQGKSALMWASSQGNIFIVFYPFILKYFQGGLRLYRC